MKYLLSFFAVFVFGFSALAQTGKNSGARLAPTFKVPTIDGKIFSSPELRGKIIVLNLWFVGCPHCVEEIKSLNRVVDDYSGNKDVVFVGLATNDNAQLANFLKKNPFKYNVVANAGDFMLYGFGEKQRDDSYYLPFPTHVVIDREGKIAVQASGIKGVDVVKDELKRQLGGARSK